MNRKLSHEGCCQPVESPEDCRRHLARGVEGNQGVGQKNRRHHEQSRTCFCLDLVAALVSGGRTTAEISREAREEGVSQLFLAIDLVRVGDPERVRQAVQESLADLASAASLPGERVVYPGQRSAERRREALSRGVPVEPRFWEEVLAL